MKNEFLIIVGILICINSCRMPSNPLGEIKIIKRLDTIPTGGNCQDLAIDDDILVAAANYNGYFIYKINYDGETISGVDTVFYKSSDDLDSGLGDNRIESVVISSENDIAFLLDRYENIWLYKYGIDAVQYGDDRLLNTCELYGASWLSIAIDDDQEDGGVGLYFLLNHHSAELSPYCILKDDDVSLTSDIACSAIEDIIVQGQTEGTCIPENGYVWKYPGCLSGGEFAQYSTSLFWKKLSAVGLNDPAPNGEPECEYIFNQGKIAEKIYYNDGILSMSYGELGVRNFEQSTENLCVVENSNGTYEELNVDTMTAYCGIDVSGISICSTDTNWIQTMGNEIWDTGEEFTDCGCDTDGNLICEGDDGWEDEFGNGIWDAEEFIDCRIDNDGNPMCKGDDGWSDEFGNGIWDQFNEFEVLTDCGCDTNGNLMCKGDDGWEDEFGNGIWDAEEFIDCAETFINHAACCEAGGCFIDEPDCHLNTSITGFKAINNRYPGKDGVYSSRGGINPQIYSQFDTPGEVETVYSINHTIFTGLSHSNGCIISILNDIGSVSESNRFAVGYTIKGIHQDGGLLALAAGNDGILLYNWNGGTDVSFIGKIETSYANNVKVASDIIFAATEDGIEVIQIDR